MLISLLMVSLKSLASLKIKQISEIEVGAFVVNLGQVIEIEKQENHYNLIISRLREKQVIKFEKDTSLVIL